MKRILLALSLLALPVIVLAQQADSTPESELGKTIVARDDKLSILLLREIQNPETKTVTYRVQIFPKVTSDRVEIEWFVRGVSDLGDKGTSIKKDLDIVAGQQLTESFSVTPKFFGQVGERLLARTEVRVEVSTFQAGQNYIVAARDQFDVNQDLDIYPISADYAQAKNNLQLRNTVIVIGLIVLAFVAGLFGITWFHRWLKAGE